MDEIGGGWHTAERAGRAGPGGLESHDGGCSSLSQEEDYKADPSSLQIIYPTKPDYVRDFWLSKAEKQFPLLAVAANKLPSAIGQQGGAHTTACATAFVLRQLRKWCM